MYKRYYARSLAAAAVVAATAFFAAPALATASSGDTVIAIVNGDKIYKKDVDKAVDVLTSSVAQSAGVDKKKLFPLVVDQVINEKLIDAAATQAKVQDSDEYKKRLDALKGQLVKQVYVDQVIKDKVTDSAVKAEYDKFRSANKGKEEVHASHILVKTEDEAKQIIRDLDSGKSWDDLVKQRSSDTQTAAHGGDLGWFTKDDMVKPFSDAAFQLKPGEYTKEPVHTDFGWHVIKLHDRHALSIPALNKDLSDQIRQKLANDALTGLVHKLRDKASIKLFDENGKPLTFGEKKGDDAAPAKDAGGEDVKKDDGDKKE